MFRDELNFEINGIVIYFPKFQCISSDGYYGVNLYDADNTKITFASYDINGILNTVDA